MYMHLPIGPRGVRAGAGLAAMVAVCCVACAAGAISLALALGAPSHSSRRTSERERKSRSRAKCRSGKGHRGAAKACKRKRPRAGSAARPKSGKPAVAPAPSMAVGLNAGAVGSAGAQDVASTFGWDRVDVGEGESAGDFTRLGLKVDLLFSGPYNTDGVSGLDAGSWSQNAVETFQSQCGGSASACPAVEVLNEPYGSWFWGGDADSADNEAAYANLVVTTYDAFHSRYGSSSPKILAAFAGDGWWAGVKAAKANIDDYFDGITVHPYGGVSDPAQSALGNRALVAEAHSTTGKPVWITEVGWPTAVGQPATEDSLQWTQPQQASNIYNFVNWARSTGYVAAVLLFQYRDYGTNMWYGVETSSGSKKPAWTALNEAAHEEACTVCG